MKPPVYHKRLIIKFDKIKLGSHKVSLKKRKKVEFSKKNLYFGTFGWNLKKTIAIFLISNLEFFNMRSFL